MSCLKQKEKDYCISCKSTLEKDHIGILCIQNHNICSDCTTNFVSYVFEDPLQNLPAKCPTCSQEIPSLIFERQLNRNQIEIYQLYMINSKLGKDEETKRCPFCQYFEIWFKSSSANFFYCKNAICSKISCNYCHKSVVMPKTDHYEDYKELEDLMIKQLNLDEEDNEEEYEESLKASNGIYHHFICADLNQIKVTLEKAIEGGQKRVCPQCNLSGRKDEQCTHMTCSKCQTKWCYFCGLSENDCDKDNGGVSIYDHNIGWQYNDKRCPMYFTEIFEFDDRWPEDEEMCLEKFHDLLTKISLKGAIEEIGVEKYEEAAKQFLTLKNCGYSLKDLNDEELKKPFVMRISKEEFQKIIDEEGYD